MSAKVKKVIDRHPVSCQSYLVNSIILLLETPSLVVCMLCKEFNYVMVDHLMLIICSL